MTFRTILAAGMVDVLFASFMVVKGNAVTWFCVVDLTSDPSADRFGWDLSASC